MALFHHLDVRVMWADTDPARIVECARAMLERPRDWINPFGDGRSGLRIVDLLRGAAQPATLDAPRRAGY